MNHGFIYHFISGLFSLLALALLSFSLFADLPSEAENMIYYVDLCLCAFFFFDFCKSLYHADHKVKYFMTLGWIDLISSIPLIDAFRFGRLAKLFKIIRVFRVYRTGRLLAQVFLKDVQKNTLFLGISFAILNVLLGSVVILLFEKTSEANIKTAGDAIWWSFVTMTTVGYGDHYPVTLAGRITAIILMFTGITLFGIITASLGGFIIRNDEPDASEKNINLLLQEVRELKEEVRSLKLNDK